VFQTVTARLPVAVPPAFGPLVRGNLIRSLRRRYWALATGTVGVGLVIALGVALASFSDLRPEQARRFDLHRRLGPSRHSQPAKPAASPDQRRRQVEGGRRGLGNAGRLQARELRSEE